MSAKIVIAGPFGVGKTSLVEAISEIPPLTTEAILTSASLGVDSTSGTPGKTTTTVAMDFGRITLEPQLILYLFGTPGQRRFWFMWDEVARGAIGAVVLVDARRLADSFGPLDYFDARHLPYVVVANTFPGQPDHTVADLREALALATDVPVVRADVRERDQVAAILAVLVEHALTRRRAPMRRPGP
ncbi:MAG: ATP/GTP-binding protein [Micromonosporaceae bacterium]|nr:ATP/GTP-binding protein [Micromonosporaceae bacterium]